MQAQVRLTPSASGNCSSVPCSRTPSSSEIASTFSSMSFSVRSRLLLLDSSVLVIGAAAAELLRSKPSLPSEGSVLDGLGSGASTSSRASKSRDLKLGYYYTACPRDHWFCPHRGSFDAAQGAVYCWKKALSALLSNFPGNVDFQPGSLKLFSLGFLSKIVLAM